jgi:Tfp pilus assembly protein PilX
VSPLKTFTRPQGDEEGFALLMVIACMVIGSLFAFAALGYALNTQRFSRTNQDWNGALAAAQAGVDDYIAHLNRNDGYSTASPATNCASNVAIQSAAYCGAALPGWVQIDPANKAAGLFHYDIDASTVDKNGIVEVTSTGRVGTKTRSLQVGVGRGGSTDFLYYTDHEDADPNNAQAYGQNADGSSQMDPRCSEYWWDTPNDRKTDTGPANCSEITFIGGDVLDGRAHFNDTPLLTDKSGVKPSFTLGYETSDPRCQTVAQGAAVGSAVIPGTPSTYSRCDRTGNSANFGSSWPTWAPTLQLPDNSDQFKNYPGCQYSGATRIKFIGDGTMRVWSKESTLPLTTAACGGGTLALTTTGGAAGVGGAVVPVPTDQVIYVRGGTAGVHQCLPQEIGDGLPLGVNTSPTPGLAKKAYREDSNMLLTTQFCGQGNAYVEGVLKGRVTVATSNSITATGDLVLANGLAGTDMLGLVAANSVEVYHPMIDDWECTTTCTTASNWHWDNTPSDTDPLVTGWPHRYPDVDQGNVPYPTVATDGIQITGSIQTLQHSFVVQSYAKGTPQGQLYVRGSIAQEWRGAVGTSGGSTGYFKDYHYDKRLRFASPPYFPQWAKAKWASSYTGEVPPAYRCPSPTCP